MKRIGKQLRHVAGLVLIAALLTACTEKMNDLEKYIVSVKERPADPISPIPPVKTYTPYEYEGLTGRDPFRQSISEGLLRNKWRWPWSKYLKRVFVRFERERT